MSEGTHQPSRVPPARGTCVDDTAQIPAVALLLLPFLSPLPFVFVGAAVVRAAEVEGAVVEDAVAPLAVEVVGAVGAVPQRPSCESDPGR